MKSGDRIKLTNARTVPKPITVGSEGTIYGFVGTKGMAREGTTPYVVFPEVPNRLFPIPHMDLEVIE